jgi:hypothetical protein
MASIRATREFGRPSLEHLLAWSDAINKTIPTTTELSGAYTRLVASGFAIRSGDAIMPTRKAIWLNRRLNWWRRSSFEATQALAKALKRFSVPHAESIVLTDQQVQAAYENYHREASALAAQLIGELTRK